jgi:hypothetical protein
LNQDPVHDTPVTIDAEQLRHDSAVVPSGGSPRVHPWQKTLPPVLYKYYPPERFHVLTDCAVRFSQREVFDDQHDLRPEVANFGTAEEIQAFMEIDPVLHRYPQALKETVVKYVLGTPGLEQQLIQQAQEWLTAPEEFGVFCLCENASNRSMWDGYAANGKGFVVAFDTQHPGFSLLRTPGLIGRVEYSNERISSFLSRYGATSFFQKKKQYSFEAEWRSVRALRRFKQILRPAQGPAVYLGPFDPACIPWIRVLPECAVEWELRTLTAIDARYRHTHVTLIDLPRRR